MNSESASLVNFYNVKQFTIDFAKQKLTIDIFLIQKI